MIILLLNIVYKFVDKFKISQTLLDIEALRCKAKHYTAFTMFTLTFTKFLYFSPQRLYYNDCNFHIQTFEIILFPLSFWCSYHTKLSKPCIPTQF